MIKLKSVYLTDDGQWFETREEAERYELINDIQKYLDDDEFPCDIGMVEYLLKRYKIEERYDYVAPVVAEIEEGEAK